MKVRVTVSAVLLCAFAGIAAAQPANDLCANAQVLTGAGTYQGRTTSATNDGTSTCGSATSPDVWYTYTATAADAGQTMTVETCSSTSGLDTVLTAFAGSCAGAQIACNDNTPGCGATGTQSRLLIPLATGQTYVVRVCGRNGTTGGFVLTVNITAPPPPTNTGPDVIVGDVSDASSWGAVGTISAYSYGTTSCNIGDANIKWIAGTNEHPVIGQNLFRLKGGRFEMIGGSWLKHGFTALTQNLCATCSGQGGVVLGIGCSDPYVSSLNGDQGRLGPRSHVNATTGFYPYPFTTPGAGYMVPPAAAATIGRRLQVLTTDVAPASNVGARFFAECQYITADDARYVAASTNEARNGLNNISWRESGFNATNQASMIGNTVRQQTALMAWRQVDPTVTVQSFDYVTPTVINGSTINFVGRFWVATKVTNNGNGTFTYRYVVQNLNSDRSASSFVLPTQRATASGDYYHGVTYHSGESVDMNASWTFAGGSGISWSTPQTFAQNPNTSAIRWSTAATFEVTTNTAPTTGNATLAFFKPVAGQADTLTLSGLTVPGNGRCPSDFNADNVVDLFDYLDFVNAFSSADIAADFNHDSIVDFTDYLDFVSAFSSGC